MNIMPKININGADIYYEESGHGQETVIFSHGFLMSGRMFDHQVAVLKDRFRCIAYDHRGQGRSEVTESGYDIDSITEDARVLIESLDAAPCHFVGLSMGGFVGMRLAFRYPALLQSLTLLETSADPEDANNITKYKLLNFVARWFGLRVVIGQVMPLLFGQSFMQDQARKEEKEAWRESIISGDRLGISRTLLGFVDRESVHEQCTQISVPALVIVGEEDVATPLDKARKIQAQVPESELVIIPEAGHSSPVENPEAVNAALEKFLVRQLDTSVPT
jgi:pimeloyl-ACP methyl ester carboxylesterase